MPTVPQRCAMLLRKRERMKTGLAVYNAELTKLRQCLEEHDRGKALLAENASLRRANSVLRQNAAEHGLDTDALILSTAGLSTSGLDWELLGLGPDHTGLLRLLPPSSQSEDSIGEGSAPPVVEVSESHSKAPPGSGSLDEESAEHSFIRPSSDSSVEPSTEVSVSGSDSGGLFGDEPDEDPPRKRKRLRQNAVVRAAKSSSSKLPAARRLSCPSVDLKRKMASAAIPSAIRSGHKKARPSTPESRSPPRPILEEGEIADDAGFDPGTEAPIGGASARPSPLSGVRVSATSGQGQSAAADSAASKSVVEVLDLTIDDSTDLSSKKDSSPFSSPVVSYFPRQDGRPRRSTSVVSELRIRESLERELADDDFMLGLTSEGSVAATSTPPQGTAQAVITPAGAAELSTEKSVVTEPSTADSSVEAQVPPESSSAETPGGAAVESVAPTISTPPPPVQGSPPPPPRQPSAVPIFQLLNEFDVVLAALGGSDASVKGSEVDNESSAELGIDDSVESSTAPVQHAAQPSQATEVSVRPSSRTRRGRGHVVQSDPRPRRPTLVIMATVTARRGTDTTTFAPAVAAISQATNSQKLPANAECFLKPGFTAVGAQKAWCKMLNVSLFAPAPIEHSPPLDFAFLALMRNVRSSRHPWRVLYDRMPNEPLTFSLGKFVKGVRISIRASGLSGLVRMRRRFSGHCYEDNEKVYLCVALWERRHWLQVSSMDNAIQAFRKASDPRDPFTRVVLSLWADLNRTRNNRADLLRQEFDRLWDWPALSPILNRSVGVCSYHRGLVSRAAALENCSIDSPAEHPYNTTYAPCNPVAPVFVPASMTRQAVISGIAVDQSLADADLVAP
ncbi:hypothetical protein PHMEG_00024867 [Phytophthora megakarya]|uniref:Uncharacterized protein n=1 Tax=Phytophthora megakarya TaxID=4795 RepID=A0A225VEP1_9STRA|nr:hypothetical protein PHMEG_00024867 [Phytophthora megakarya]